MNRYPAYQVHPFKLLYWLTAGMDRAGVADLCGVSVRTVKRWENADAPAWAYLVIEYRAGLILDPAFAGWRVHGGHLWTPEDQALSPGEIRALPFLAELARLEHRPGQLDLFNRRG